MKIYPTETQKEVFAGNLTLVHWKIERGGGGGGVERRDVN